MTYVPDRPVNPPSFYEKRTGRFKTVKCECGAIIKVAKDEEEICDECKIKSTEDKNK